MGRILLASASPRRRELLSALGVEFEAIDPSVDELCEGAAAEVVVENAIRKARAGAARLPGRVVIGADTDVVLDGEILGKPASAAAASEMIGRLLGREHQVHGGLAVIDAAGQERTAHELSTVRFHDWPEAVDSYVASGAWRGFAGGYAIQGLGSMLVASVEGDVANVIGLPLRALARLLPVASGER